MAEPDGGSDLPSGNISISGGNIHIEAGQCGIYTEAGDVSISGGTLYTKAENQTGSGDAVGIYSVGKIEITAGEVFACGMGEGVSGVGLYSEASLSISGGIVTAQGVEQAVFPAPTLSGYPEPCVRAAADFSGKELLEYNEGNISSYLYFNISSGKYSLRFENGTANISAPFGFNAEVLFAAFDETGTLVDFERKKAVLAPGTNSIAPEHFQPESGNTVKVMLWNSADSMKPLCSADVSGS